MIAVALIPAVRVRAIAVRPCAHVYLRFLREYRGASFFKCCGCGREIRSVRA